MPNPSVRYLPSFIALATGDHLFYNWVAQGLPQGVASLISEFWWVGPYWVSTMTLDREEGRVIAISP